MEEGVARPRRRRTGHRTKHIRRAPGLQGEAAWSTVDGTGVVEGQPRFRLLVRSAESRTPEAVIWAEHGQRARRFEVHHAPHDFSPLRRREGIAS